MQPGEPSAARCETWDGAPCACSAGVQCRAGRRCHLDLYMCNKKYSKYALLCSVPAVNARATGALLQAGQSWVLHGTMFTKHTWKAWCCHIGTPPCTGRKLLMMVVAGACVLSAGGAARTVSKCCRSLKGYCRFFFDQSPDRVLAQVVPVPGILPVTRTQH